MKFMKTYRYVLRKKKPCRYGLEFPKHTEKLVHITSPQTYGILCFQGAAVLTDVYRNHSLVDIDDLAANTVQNLLWLLVKSRDVICPYLAVTIPKSVLSSIRYQTVYIQVSPNPMHNV